MRRLNRAEYLWNRMNSFSNAPKPRNTDPSKPKPQFKSWILSQKTIELEDEEEFDFYHDGRKVKKTQKWS